MTQTILGRRIAALVLTIAAALSAMAPARAGDRALIDVIGYSDDLRYLAFEEFGVQDGSGFAYSSLYVVDLVDDKWVAGTPYRERGADEDVPLAEVRARVAAAAKARLEALKIDMPAQIVALMGDGVLDPKPSMRFGYPAYGLPGQTEGDFTLSIETFAAPAPAGCDAELVGEMKGFALTLSGDGAPRELHRDQGTLPKSRGCAMDYAIYAVVFPYLGGGLENAVAVVSTYPYGFEGPDRRFLVVPFGK
jgi:predicted secreted protein